MCIYICMYVCMHVCMHACMCVCMCLFIRLDCADREDAERVWTGTGTRVRTIPVLRLALSYLRVLVPVVLPMHRISSDCLFKACSS